MKKSKKALIWVLGIIGFIILTIIDRVTKNMAVELLTGKPDVPVINDLFVLRYLENRGAAFGIMQGQRLPLVIVTVVILFIIIYVFLRLPYKRHYLPLRVIMVLIGAGAVGNFIDRIVQAYVVDFLYIKVINFPIFNVADIYVTCSAVALIIYLIFFYKDDDFQEMGQALGIEKKKNEDQA